MTDDNDRSAEIWQAGYDAAVADINARSSSNTANYFLVKTGTWNVVVDGTLAECQAYIEAALLNGDRSTYVCTFGQLATVHDIAQLRRDNMTRRQREYEYQRRKSDVHTTDDPNTVLAIEPGDMN